jgi:NAD(P)-dependent dehydrogenase (short-subunit alcohol dehydrogenase family)
MQQFAGKTALVTGASRGEGLALTSELLRWNARVVAGDRNPKGAGAWLDAFCCCVLECSS